ncbi:hypothetical protein, partial [Microcystis sp.]|uniref:hypothetical protein n=1 Tax=Microcystis sp. TaxID=1127 RepID=UPI003919FB5B
FGRTRCAPTGVWGTLGSLGAGTAPLRGVGVGWGFLGARNAPLRVFGGLGARTAPLRVFGGIWVIWSHAMRPYAFWGNLGYLGARDAPLRVLDAAEGEKPPHQVNLDTFREKIFLYRESLK